MDKPSVLIVEDNRLLNVILAAVAQEVGLQPMKALGPEIALQVLAETPPAVVVVDVDAPLIDLPSFWEECHQTGFKGPVVLAGHQVSQLDTTYAAGVIAKPFDADEIRRTLMAVLPSPG